jgi:hypothetical protein
MRLREDDAARCRELLERLRALDALTERSPGVFYRSSAPFLHFHGSGRDLVADLKVDDAWLRYPAATVVARRTIAADARRVLAGTTTGLRGRVRAARR